MIVVIGRGNNRQTYTVGPYERARTAHDLKVYLGLSKRKVA